MESNFPLHTWWNAEGVDLQISHAAGGAWVKHTLSRGPCTSHRRISLRRTESECLHKDLCTDTHGSFGRGLSWKPPWCPSRREGRTHRSVVTAWDTQQQPVPTVYTQHGRISKQVCPSERSKTRKSPYGSFLFYQTLENTACLQQPEAGQCSPGRRKRLRRGKSNFGGDGCVIAFLWGWCVGVDVSKLIRLHTQTRVYHKSTCFT
jgi:hypothetical protein